MTIEYDFIVAGVEPFASRLKADPNDLINVFAPEDLNVVVAGGKNQGAWNMISGDYVGEATHSIDKWR